MRGFLNPLYLSVFLRSFVRVIRKTNFNPCVFPPLR